MFILTHNILYENFNLNVCIKKHRLYLCVFFNLSLPISRVLSWIIINLGVLLPARSVAILGTSEQPICPTSCIVQSLQRTYVTIGTCELLPHLFTLTNKWRYISVALFLRSPWLDVIKCTCSVMLGLSSPP